MNGITKETFKDADTDTKLLILFDYIQEIHVQQAGHPLACNSKFDKIDTRFEKFDTRFEKLEGGRVKDTATASLMGFFGGFVAVLSKKFFGM